ncbi:protein-L-isoaspartate(D-aspartate) O-methyltransferase [Babesia caballi]|uniref:Protein-L-isoaspartate(D-aspartate) O-methyltransferase n=1 Tax=Babesia caballi TaxID=5871 RepID=A0AAV4LU13_BABCB|nr:protein-L-isoaspartate(D-aspartate) O-methyltransferase [Babesia caballi]
MGPVFATLWAARPPSWGCTAAVADDAGARGQLLAQRDVIGAAILDATHLELRLRQLPREGAAVAAHLVVPGRRQRAAAEGVPLSLGEHEPVVQPRLQLLQYRALPQHNLSVVCRPRRLLAHLAAAGAEVVQPVVLVEPRVLQVDARQEQRLLLLRRRLGRRRQGEPLRQQATMHPLQLGAGVLLRALLGGDHHHALHHLDDGDFEPRSQHEKPEKPRVAPRGRYLARLQHDASQAADLVQKHFAPLALRFLRRAPHQFEELALIVRADGQGRLSEDKRVKYGLGPAHHQLVVGLLGIGVLRALLVLGDGRAYLVQRRVAFLEVHTALRGRLEAEVVADMCPALRQSVLPPRRRRVSHHEAGQREPRCWLDHAHHRLVHLQHVWVSRGAHVRCAA